MTKEAKSDSGQTSSVHATPATPAAVSRESAEHYRWGVDCDGWHLVKDKQLSVIEEFMPPGSAEIRHYHERAQQFFYILTGEVLMEIDGENVLIPAGSGVRIMPGIGIRFAIHPRARCAFWSSRSPAAATIVSKCEACGDNS